LVVNPYPLNADGAGPPLRLLRDDHFELHQVTVVVGVDAATVRSPSTNVPAAR